jgi:hypothetical protein
MIESPAPEEAELPEDAASSDERTTETDALDDDDEGRAFEELIEAMVVPGEAAIEADEAQPRYPGPRSLAADEFTCGNCFLILPRSLLVDKERTLCGDCATRSTPEAQVRSRRQPLPTSGRS